MKKLLALLVVSAAVFTGCAGKLPEMDKDICNNFSFDEKTINFRMETMENGSLLVKEYDKKDRAVRDILYNADKDKIIAQNEYIYGSHGDYIRKSGMQPFDESGGVSFTYVSREQDLEITYNYEYLASAGKYMYTGHRKFTINEDNTVWETLVYDENDKETERNIIYTDKDGNITGEETYKDGVISRTTHYDPFPDKSVTTYYIDGKKHTLVTGEKGQPTKTEYYDENGNLTDKPVK